MSRVSTRRPGASVHAITERYIATFRGLLDRVDVDAVQRVVDHLRTARDHGATIYLAGNGGSAATASHFANDLGKATKRGGCPPVRVLCLSDNTPWLTALANDEGYDRVFVGQLENFARPGDVLLVISASGNSANLVHAVDHARARGLVTLALLGFDGGVLMDRVDDRIWLETERGAYGVVECGHSVLCDILVTCLMQDRPAAAEAPWS